MCIVPAEALKGREKRGTIYFASRGISEQGVGKAREGTRQIAAGEKNLLIGGVGEGRQIGE